MGGRAKGAVAVAVAGLALAVLLVLAAGARHRGRLAHCRNNLRHLGGLAVRNWALLDPARTGRDFWQQVREAQYRDVRGRWQPIHPDPFVCPVLGTTASRPDAPETIDYLGPRAVREQAKDTPPGEPIGADRPGNHPGGGGHVLRLDTSTGEVNPFVERLAGTSPAWREALGFLKD
ncbi:MAG: hypothetical protein ACK44W_08220 [Planctomycetota bacterium]